MRLQIIVRWLVLVTFSFGFVVGEGVGQTIGACSR